jgi:predicted nucleotidyltransferase
MTEEERKEYEELEEEELRFLENTLCAELRNRYPIQGDDEPRRYGIRESYWQRMQGIFRHHPNIERVILYGSRAKGTNRPYSDIDITLVGSALTFDELSKIEREIDDLLLPFFFDISIYNKLTNEKFIASIDRTGIPIYCRE